MAVIERFRGALVGCACGDALGYPLRDLSVPRIKRKFGPFGLRTLVRDLKNGKKAQISGNTQLLLATLDGLLWTDAKKLLPLEGLYRGYMRWYYSQTGEEPRRGQKTWMRRQPHEREFCLVHEPFMHERRAPEDGLLPAFSKEGRGSTKYKVNESTGSAVLSRAIPIGLLLAGEAKESFDLAVKAGALSHSTYEAYYSAGALASLMSLLADGYTLPKAIEHTEGILGKFHKTDGIIGLMEAAVEQAFQRPAGKSNAWDHLDNIRSLGTGVEAKEALAIAVYLSLAIDDPLDAMIASANHDGQSQTTAAITGAIEGARFGEKALPSYWTDVVEGKEDLDFFAQKLFYVYEKMKNRDITLKA